MQQIKFTTATTTIILSDSGRSIVDGDPAPVVLYDFDANSLGSTAATVKCIDMDGQHTISTAVNPRTIGITLTYDGIEDSTDTEAAMYTLRRLILKSFPLGADGELEYTNANGTFKITAHATEYPGIERQLGTLCKATFYLVADYPYWHQDIIGDEVTVQAGEVAARACTAQGDIDSPVLCEIYCDVDMTTTISTGVYFTIYRQGGGARMDFVKPLLAGQKLTFSSGLNNEVYVTLTDTDDSTRIANDYVDYRTSELLVNTAGERTVWQINIYATTGTIRVKMTYQNIYWSV